VVHAGDLELIAKNLQRVFIPGPDKSKRKLDEELSSRTRSRAMSELSDDDTAADAATTVMAVADTAPSLTMTTAMPTPLVLPMQSTELSQRRRMVIECKSLRAQVSIPTCSFPFFAL
jgi:hypothetical protein